MDVSDDLSVPRTAGVEAEAELPFAPGAGHDVHEDDPVRVNPVLLEFLGG